VKRENIMFSLTFKFHLRGKWIYHSSNIEGTRSCPSNP